jgi:hypothetical protein
VFVILSVSARNILLPARDRIKRFEVNTDGALCPNPAKEMTLKFDEIPIPTAEGYNSGLSQPYNGYIFTKVNTPYSAWPDNHVPVLNTSNPVVGPALTNASVSNPNVLISSGESLSISRQRGGGSPIFTLVSFYATSIYLNNMAIFVNSFSSGVLVNRTTAILQLRFPTQVITNMKNIDTILIGCVNPDWDNCYPFVYDNFNVC